MKGEDLSHAEGQYGTGQFPKIKKTTGDNELTNHKGPLANEVNEKVIAVV